MRILKLFLLFAAITFLASCNKLSIHDVIIKTGKLEKQGFTTYMYGTHVLVVGSTPKYVLESKHINLDQFVGMHVIITAENEHYQAEMGPDLYNVTSIAPAP
jgi:hypothetical protein